MDGTDSGSCPVMGFVNSVEPWASVTTESFMVVTYDNCFLYKLVGFQEISLSLSLYILMKLNYDRPWKQNGRKIIIVK